MAGFSNGVPANVKNGNGKRERADQEDDQEFMPLSKRINNIHLSPERLINGNHSAAYLHINGASGPALHSYSNGHHEISTQQLSHSYSNHQPNGFRGSHLGDVNNFSDSSGDGRGSFHSSSSPEHNISYPNVPTSEIPGSSIQASDLGSEYSNYHYRPSLNQSANPHYYESNRALFELYIQRQMRTNQVPHPNVFGAPGANGII